MRLSPAAAALAALAILAGAPPARAGAAPRATPPGPGVTAVVLGTAQDGGVPQVNCRCGRCTAARRDPGRRRRVASLALLDPAAGQAFLVDATPDLPAQLERLIDDPALPLPAGRTPLAGILLTHAHFGHYAGLGYLGREVLASAGLPVLASARMVRFLETNAPWSQLVGLGQICPSVLEPGARVELTPRLAATALRVPHRDELSDTLAFLIEGPRRKLLWLPDIDRWESWDEPLDAVLDRVDVAFLDGTFADAGELPGRSLRDIPHPLVTDTAARLAPGAATRRARVYLIHLNHSNALAGDDPPPELSRALDAARIEVAPEGLRVGL